MKRKLSPVVEQSVDSKEDQRYPALVGSKMDITKKSCYKLSSYIQSIIFTFTSDLENGGIERGELACLTIDSVAVVANQSDVLNLAVNISGFQFDNQLYSTGSYDFPVIIIGDRIPMFNSCNVLNKQIKQLVHETDMNSLMSLNLTMESWVDEILHKDVSGKILQFIYFLYTVRPYLTLF